MSMMKKYKIAVLDDYQNVALESADWSVLRDRAEITAFQNHLAAGRELFRNESDCLSEMDLRAHS
jgi:hypothetical protein